jgi:Cys-rich protein (TIGR01571 family)
MATVVYAQPPVMNPNIPLPKQNAWTTELFDMCALPSGAGRCFYTLCFPGCAHGEMAAMAPPGSVACAGNCYGACCLWGFFGPLFTCMAAQSIRNHYGIPGGVCSDILAGICTPCGILQQSREITIRTAHKPVVIMMPTMTYAPAPVAMGQPAQAAPKE